MQQDDSLPSTKPYFIRALYEWCSDAGLTPYLTVAVDGTVMVPAEYVKDGEITLNVGADATTGLLISNEAVSFKARFRGAVREIMVPVARVRALFARENGQGMVFPVSESPEPGVGARPAGPALRSVQAAPGGQGDADAAAPQADGPKPGGRPSLVRIK